MTESERIARLAHEFSTRVGGAVKDMIPPEAQHHLLNAQRELLTALFLIYEHQAGGRRAQPRRSTRPRSANARSRSQRLDKIDIE